VRPATRTPTVNATSGGVATAINAEIAIAVLPFQAAEADAYLADGLVEDLIDILSTTAALRVRPAGALHGYHQADPREAGKQLGVDHVVSGSVRRTPAGLRVTARLVGIADGFQIWAHRADITETEVLALSDELARGIAQALSTRAAAATTPMAPAAVDLYLRARAELRRFWGEHAEEATKLLEQADAIAPGSGPILSTLAYASVQTWVRQGAVELLERAQRHVERGLACGYGESHLAASSLELNLGNHESAAHELGVALARSPMAAPVHESAGRLLLEIASSRDAGLRHLETAIGLDPGRTLMVQPELARIDALAGDWDGVKRRIGRMLSDSDPAIVQFGLIIEARFDIWQHKFEGIGNALERVRTRSTGEITDQIALYRRWHETGELDAAPWREYVARMFQPGQPHRPQLATLQRFAEVAAAIEKDEALELVLRTAAKHGLLDRVWLDGVPLFERVRGATWFEDVRDQVRTRADRVLAAFRGAGG
jgi:serine/threonine-protein kinase